MALAIGNDARVFAMARIRYTASQFPAALGAPLAGSHVVDVSWSELLWAAISVGRAELQHIFQYGRYSAFEIVYRSALVYANLCEMPTGHVRRSEAYDGLDPSEKSAISYFMGLTLVKLFADRLLQVPYLMHLDVYRAQLQAVMQPGRSRPDLVGRNFAGDWIVVESKGRTNEYDDNAMDKVKQQTQLVVTIGGAAPVLRVAGQGHFEDGVLECSLVDPKAKQRKRSKRLELPLSERDIVQEYYRPFRSWLNVAENKRQENVEGRPFTVARVPDVDVEVGLPDTLRVPGAAGPGGRQERLLLQDRTYVGSVSVLVRPGGLWTPDNMRREPQERRLPQDQQG